MNCLEDENIYVEMSFTFLNWKFAENIASDYKMHTISEFPAYVIKLLCLSVFPNGNTILHYVYDDPTEIENIYKAI